MCYPEGVTVSPAYLIQGQLTGDSAIARTPYTVASNSPKVGTLKNGYARASAVLLACVLTCGVGRTPRHSHPGDKIIYTDY
jgi:hypothetical protein